MRTKRDLFTVLAIIVVFGVVWCWLLIVWTGNVSGVVGGGIGALIGVGGTTIWFFRNRPRGPKN